MENRSRVCDIKKKFEVLNVQNEFKPNGNRDQGVMGKCHIKRSNAFRSDKPPAGVRPSEGVNKEQTRPSFAAHRNNVANILSSLPNKCTNTPIAIIKPSDIKNRKISAATKNKVQNNPVLFCNDKLVSSSPKINVNAKKNSVSPCSNLESRPSTGKQPVTPTKVTDKSHLPEIVEEMLKTPLPKGPPPKKPPRTFQHVVARVVADGRTGGELQEVCINVVESKPKAGLKATLSADADFLRPPPPARSKTEPHIVIKKLNPAFLTSIFGHSPAQPPTRDYTSDSRGKRDTLLCLNTFNCVQKNIYDVPFESKSTFFTDLVKPNKSQTLDNAYGTLKKPTSTDHIYSVPYSPNLSRKLKKLHTASLTFKSSNNEQKKPQNISTDTKKPLYYMSSPIADADPKVQLVGSPGQIGENNNRGTKRTRSHESQNIDSQKVHLMLKDLYGKLNGDSPTDSDTDSAASNAEEVPPSVNHEQLSAKRKVYVRQMSSMKRPFSPGKSPSNSLFDVLLLIGLDSDPVKGKVPYIKSKYPQSSTTPSWIEDLCFPDARTWPPKLYWHNNYTLVLTNQEGERKYAYCRRVQPEGAPICLPLAYCIITSNRSSGFYYKVLAELESHHGQPENKFKQFVQKLHETKFPACGEAISWFSNSILRRPTDWRREHNDLIRLIKTVTLPLFVQLFSTLLLERKVLLIGSNISKVSDCIEGLQTCLFPFEWQHTLVTSLPNSMLELCHAPTPYLVGVVTSNYPSLPLSQIDEVLIVDIDSASVLRRVGDEGTVLPKKFLKCLRSALAIAMSCDENNIVASEALLRLFVELVGHYREHIITSQEDNNRYFQRESFVKGVESRSVQMFLDWFSETAMFQVFISDQLDRAYKPGLFELKCVEYVGENSKNRNSKRKNVILKNFGKTK